MIQIAKIEAALKPHRDSFITGSFVLDGNYCPVGGLGAALGLDMGRGEMNGADGWLTKVRKEYGLSIDDTHQIYRTSDAAGGGADSMDAVMKMLRERMES